MPFGILEDKHMELVPGTDRLKHGTGRYSHIILVPQPSDSPNDPLNWPLWQKDMILAIVGLSAGVVGAYGPMLGPGFVPISKELGITVEVLSQSTAWLILTLGLIVFLMNPLAKIYGKRPTYIFASVVLFIVSIWGAVAKDYSSFLGSRILGAFGMAPYEVLVQSTIADLYFVHQRATRIAVWNLFLLTGIAGAGFISGYIIENLGYKWTFGICAILFGILMILIVLCVPETSYVRPRVISHLTPATNGHEEEYKTGMDEKSGKEHIEAVPIPEHVTGNGRSANSESKHSYWRSLSIFTGRYTDAPTWKIFTRPLIVFWYPPILWGFLVYGTTLTWIVVFSVVNGVLFTSPPYNFTVGEAGLTSLSPFILCMIGEAISGPLNDWICLKLTKRNHGIYEPEFRLVLMSVVVILGTVGFFGFGLTVHYVTQWSGPVLTYGLANMSLAFAKEAFVAINTRNLLTFGLTYFVNSWLGSAGALAVFNILGACFLAVCALTVPLWVFGKRSRSWIARNRFLNSFMLDM
ncbi:hypothetical protein MBLNU459_g5699t2 [Dothideomycetes sp. NU459]